MVIVKPRLKSALDERAFNPLNYNKKDNPCHGFTPCLIRGIPPHYQKVSSQIDCFAALLRNCHCEEGFARRSNLLHRKDGYGWVRSRRK
jgi:hypothetical protein